MKEYLILHFNFHLVNGGGLVGNRGVAKPLFMWPRLAPPGRVLRTSKDGTEGKKL